MFHCQHHERKPEEKEGHWRIQVKHHPCAPVYFVYCVLPTSVMDLIKKKLKLKLKNIYLVVLTTKAGPGRVLVVKCEVEHVTCKVYNVKCTV